MSEKSKRMFQLEKEEARNRDELDTLLKEKEELENKLKILIIKVSFNMKLMTSYFELYDQGYTITDEIESLSGVLVTQLSRSPYDSGENIVNLFSSLDSKEKSIKYGREEEERIREEKEEEEVEE